ncbi:hypothetical protein KY285_029366 [Solanum tuberosum]|nr:hypothetical protein KY285_029366 [Solanum tuberosum]
MKARAQELIFSTPIREEIFNQGMWDGILKNRGTYEFISAEDVGIIRASEHGIKLGKLSGRHALKIKMLELGYNFEEKQLGDLFWRFKSMAERKKVN